MTLQEAAGLDDDAIKALVRTGHLVRTRSGMISLESAQRWATGYRPDLLVLLGRGFGS